MPQLPHWCSWARKNHDKNFCTNRPTIPGLFIFLLLTTSPFCVPHSPHFSHQISSFQEVIQLPSDCSWFQPSSSENQFSLHLVRPICGGGGTWILTQRPPCKYAFHQLISSWRVRKPECVLWAEEGLLWEMTKWKENSVRIQNVVVSGEIQTHDLSITETHARVLPLTN